MQNAHNSFWRQLMNGQLNTCGKFFAALNQQRASDAIAPETTKRFLNNPTDNTHFDAPKRLQVGTGFFTSEQHLRQHERADWQQTDPRIQLFAARFIERMRKQGIPLYVHGAFRTQEQQTALYSKGNSKANWPRAPHCQGKAVDIVHASYHWNLTPKEWQLMGKIGQDTAHALGLQITWGGNWNFYDPAHWELSDWKENIQKLRTAQPVRLTPRGILNRFKNR